MAEPDSGDARTAQQREDEAGALLDLLRRVEALKHLPRAGWVDREVAQPESVAAHAWRLALFAWLAAEAQGLDAARAVRLALVHDVPEALTGDSTPFDDHGDTPEARRTLASNPPAHGQWRDGARRQAKVAKERAALDAILAGAPDQAAAAIRSAWEEYETGASPEAQLVGQLDKLEAFLQGCEYARSGRLPHPQTLQSFRVDSERLIVLPALRLLLKALEAWAFPGADTVTS